MYGRSPFHLAWTNPCYALVNCVHFVYNLKCFVHRSTKHILEKENAKGKKWLPEEKREENTTPRYQLFDPVPEACYRCCCCCCCCKTIACLENSVSYWLEWVRKKCLFAVAQRISLNMSMCWRRREPARARCFFAAAALTFVKLGEIVSVFGPSPAKTRQYIFVDWSAQNWIIF